MIGPTSIGVIEVQMVKLRSTAADPKCVCCRNRPDADGGHHIYGHDSRIKAVLPADGEVRPPGRGDTGLRDWVESILYRSLDGQTVRFTAELIDDAGYGEA